MSFLVAGTFLVLYTVIRQLEMGPISQEKLALEVKDIWSFNDGTQIYSSRLEISIPDRMSF
jgi:hypothetical protein